MTTLAARKAKSMKAMPQVLICDDDRTFHLAVKHSLKGRFDCKSAYDTAEAFAILAKQKMDVLMLDIQMRTPTEGLDALPKIRDSEPDLAIVMTSGLTDFPTVREALRRGANDYIPKDFNPDDLDHTLESLLERRKISKRAEQRNFEVAARDRSLPLIGQSPAIQALRKTIDKVRNSPANVLITGETGTGKEVVARQLRGRLEDNTLAPFVAVDSATIQGSTAESALFGHEKGAFTGAERQTKGVFEEADGGIVYFDELGNMPLNIQAKLLRAIQEKEVVRLGSSKPIQLDFRVVCATNRDLEIMIRGGEFKDDLYQRLNVLPIHLPPLRERREDIPLLLNHFAERQSHGPDDRLEFSEAAIEVLSHHTWAGNIRELQNLVAYLATMADSTLIEPEDLPPKIRDNARPRSGAASAAASGNPESGDFYTQVGRFEGELLTREYAAVSGNVSKLAVRLGMDRSHLYSKLREHGIHAAKDQKNR